jgi:SOS-response transcriptional repressor LexA
MPTPLQIRLLKFIHSYIEENEYSPSYEEMSEAMGQKSKSNAHRLIDALEIQGFIKRVRDHARSVQVIKFPGLKCPNCGHMWPK